MLKKFLLATLFLSNNLFQGGLASERPLSFPGSRLKSRRQPVRRRSPNRITGIHEDELFQKKALEIRTLLRESLDSVEKGDWDQAYGLYSDTWEALTTFSKAYRQEDPSNLFESLRSELHEGLFLFARYSHDSKEYQKVAQLIVKTDATVARNYLEEQIQGKLSHLEESFKQDRDYISELLGDDELSGMLIIKLEVGSKEDRPDAAWVLFMAAFYLSYLDHASRRKATLMARHLNIYLKDYPDEVSDSFRLEVNRMISFLKRLPSPKKKTDLNYSVPIPPSKRVVRIEHEKTMLDIDIPDFELYQDLKRLSYLEAALEQGRNYIAELLNKEYFLDIFIGRLTHPDKIIRIESAWILLESVFYLNRMDVYRKTAKIVAHHLDDYTQSYSGEIPDIFLSEIEKIKDIVEVPSLHKGAKFVYDMSPFKGFFGVTRNLKRGLLKYCCDLRTENPGMYDEAPLTMSESSVEANFACIRNKRQITDRLCSAFPMRKNPDAYEVPSIGGI